MALGNFDDIEFGTKIFKNSDPGTLYSVSDAKVRFDGKAMVTGLILVKLNADGYRAATFDKSGCKVSSRKKTLEDTPANRAAWSKK